jgi:hypothetical protein
MVRRAAALSAAVALIGGGVVVADRWHDARVAECRRRSGTIAALGVLSRAPQGFSADPYRGCDEESVVAYAGTQYVGVTEQQTVIAYYRQALREDGWQVAPRDTVAALHASKKMPFGKAYADLSFPTIGLFDLIVSDADDQAVPA